MICLVRMSVVLLLLEVSNTLVLLRIAQVRSHLARHERLARRQNRPYYILHISTADLQTAGSSEHRGMSALQGW
jgi:hypothetical protein